ncbi:MAG: hypothetical protein II837_05800 [Treponema sp.]|nr:hypothetical protein [Treponema sp.]
MNLICRIEWTEDNLKEMFGHLFGQEPTEEEIADCLSEIDTEGMTETCIAVGNNIISCGIRRAVARREHENAGCKASRCYFMTSKDEIPVEEEKNE